MSILELCQVTREYSLRARRFGTKKAIKAVNQVNMTLNKGECLGLVGESGSGKSIINTLKLIKDKEQISYLFITHDLQSTKAFCDRIAVIYQGGIVETFTDWEGHLQHPYTQSLFQTLR